MSSREKTKIDFQSIILNLQSYWANKGCVILQPYDKEVGAGTQILTHKTKQYLCKSIKSEERSRG